MSTIIPNIWCNRNAAEVASFYVGTFRDAKETATISYPSDVLPEFQQEFAGQPMSVELNVAGQPLMLINARDEFRPSPSNNFMVNFDPSVHEDAREYLDEVWAKLTVGGEVRMPLQEYPFSPHYGWVEDRYGVNWQLMLTNPEGEPRPFLIPSLMFGGEAQNRAAEAVDLYVEAFTQTFSSAHDDASSGTSAEASTQDLSNAEGNESASRVANRVIYQEAPEGMPGAPVVEPGKSVMFSDAQLRGQWITAMDSGVEQPFSFTPGVSYLVECDTQQQIDTLWSYLSAVPEAEQCGWCMDRFGVSWQVVPTALPELMAKPNAYATLMSMKKIEIDRFG